MVGVFNRFAHRRHHEKDVEAGGPDNANGSNSSQQGLSDDMDEYPALDRYISTYRDETLPEEDASAKRKKKPWWKFWQFQSDAPHENDSATQMPDEWFSTDIKSGIRTEDVDERRRATGWNELTAEKENMFTKFLGYFTGPILYGKHLIVYLHLTSC